MKKKVFHIISRFDVGGAERVAMNIAAGGDDVTEHHIVELFRAQSPFTDAIIAELSEKGIHYHRSSLPVLFHWHYLAERIIACLFPLRMLYLWLRYRPDVIHTHTEMPDMAVWLSLRLMPWIRVRLVRTIHNTVLWSGMGIIGPRVERFMQQHYANVAISPNVQESYYDHYGERPEIIYNGVAPVPQQHYEGIVPGKVNVCFAGRFEHQKGIDVLCDIIRSMADDKRYHFHVFGSGSQQRIVDQQLHGLQDVTVCPPLQNIAAYMSSFDYLLMPSRHEGLSILAIEASMNGLPLLVNRIAGLIDVLPTDWQLSVADNNLDEWLHLFRDILPSSDHTAAVVAAHHFALSHFSLQQMQKQYTQMYLTLNH